MKRTAIQLAYGLALLILLSHLQVAEARGGHGGGGLHGGAGRGGARHSGGGSRGGGGFHAGAGSHSSGGFHHGAGPHSRGGFHGGSRQNRLSPGASAHGISGDSRIGGGQSRGTARPGNGENLTHGFGTAQTGTAHNFAAGESNATAAFSNFHSYVPNNKLSANGTHNGSNSNLANQNWTAPASTQQAPANTTQQASPSTPPTYPSTTNNYSYTGGSPTIYATGTVPPVTAYPSAAYPYGAAASALYPYAANAAQNYAQRYQQSYPYPIPVTVPVPIPIVTTSNGSEGASSGDKENCLEQNSNQCAQSQYGTLPTTQMQSVPPYLNGSMQANYAEAPSYLPPQSPAQDSTQYVQPISQATQASASEKKQGPAAKQSVANTPSSGGIAAKGPLLRRLQMIENIRK